MSDLRFAHEALVTDLHETLSSEMYKGNYLSFVHEDLVNDLHEMLISEIYKGNY